jgi:hypothetical protein
MRNEQSASYAASSIGFLTRKFTTEIWTHNTS